MTKSFHLKSGHLEIKGFESISDFMTKCRISTLDLGKDGTITLSNLPNIQLIGPLECTFDYLIPSAGMKP